MILGRLVRECLTHSDNETFDDARVLAVLSVITAIGLSIYAVVWRGQAFDIQTYGIGIGALFAGVGAQLKLRKDTDHGRDQA